METVSPPEACLGLAGFICIAFFFFSWIFEFDSENAIRSIQYRWLHARPGATMRFPFGARVWWHHKYIETGRRRKRLQDWEGSTLVQSKWSRMVFYLMHMSHDDVCFPCCSFQEVNCPEECKSVENQMIRLGSAWTGLAVFHRQNHFLVRSSFKWFPAAITKSAWIWRRIWCTMTPWFTIITYDLCLMSYITSVNFIKKPPKLHSRSRPPLGWLVQAQPVGYGPAKHDRCQRCVWENHRIGLCQQGVVVRVFLILVPCIDPLTLKNG